MKKIAVVGIAIAAVAAAGFFAFRSTSAQVAPAESRVSKQAADSLQAKIDRIKQQEALGNSNQQSQELEVSEIEMESYVMFSLRDDIPIQMDSIDVQLTPGTVAADTQMTFTSNSTGNPMVDAVMGGTHNLFVKGKLEGRDSRGRFELEEIRVDGIPVPKVLVQTLFDKYVKPKYPEADLKKPFELPWGIRSINIQNGTAKIAY